VITFDHWHPDAQMLIEIRGQSGQAAAADVLNELLEV
jgi:hypothetical protein